MRRGKEILTIVERLRRFGRPATIDQIVELVPEVSPERVVFHVSVLIAQDRLEHTAKVNHPPLISLPSMRKRGLDHA